jgi:hypothetical protein
MQAKAIGELEGLESIDLQLGYLPPEALNQLSKLTKVTAIELKVRDQNNDAVAAAIIRRFPQLTEIHLSGLGIGPQTFDAVGSVNSLSILWLTPHLDVDGEAFAHLLVKFSRLGFVTSFFRGVRTALKRLLGSTEQLLFPQRDLIGMHLELLGNFTDGFEFANGFQSYFRLKLRIKSSSYPRHRFSPDDTTIPTSVRPQKPN